jgi:hypothetical protein
MFFHSDSLPEKIATGYYPPERIGATCGLATLAIMLSD